jgi:hypothetical protein
MIHDLQITVQVIQGYLSLNQTTWRLCVCNDKWYSLLVRCAQSPSSCGVTSVVESSWNVTAHGEAREDKWRGNKRMEWVTSKRHMTAEHGLARAVQTLQADVHRSLDTSRLNWRPRRFKWTPPFRRKTKSCFCACAITFQTQSTTLLVLSECQSVQNQRHRRAQKRSKFYQIWTFQVHRFENVTTVTMNINVFWHLTSSNLINS